MRPVVGDSGIPRGDWRPLLSAILTDLASGVEGINRRPLSQHARPVGGDRGLTSTTS